MIGVKCPRCGLMQMPSQACKSCGAPLGGPATGYTPPPPLGMPTPSQPPGPMATTLEAPIPSKGFSKREAIRFGWITMRENPGFFVGLLSIVGLIYFLPGALRVLATEDYPFISFFLALAGAVLQIIIGMGLIRISLQFASGERGRFADLFACAPLFFKYLFGSILYGLIVSAWWVLALLSGVIAILLGRDLWFFIGDLYAPSLIWVLGLVAWITPFAILSIVWAIKYMFFGYFIVERGAGAVEALKLSGDLTKGAKWDLFLFGLLLFGVNLLGALLFLIGLFATLPTTMVATAYVYRRLQS